MADDQYYIDICTGLAKKARLKGNAPAGCVIVKNNDIIAKAGEASKSKNDISCHAEMQAVRKAVKKIGSDLSQCILYTTHEPCVMCAYPIRYHGIGKIVILSPVIFLGAISSPFPLLTTGHVPTHWGKPPDVVWYSNSPA